MKYFLNFFLKNFLLIFFLRLFFEKISIIIITVKYKNPRKIYFEFGKNKSGQIFGRLIFI